MERVKPKEGAVSGTWVALGDQEYLVPPLNFKALREITPKIASMKLDGATLPTADDITTMIEVSYAAISRNYPDITKDDLEERIDMGNFIALFQSVIKVSGLEPVPGEAAAVSQ
jgi:hypothetical protein